jgi:hypothetical protein
MEPTTGALQIAASEFSGEWFTGLIDELRIYNYPLPLSGKVNTTFGTTCVRSDGYDSTSGGTLASVIGDANCSIVPLTPPLQFKLSSGAAGFKQAASATMKVGNQ